MGGDKIKKKKTLQEIIQSSLCMSQQFYRIDRANKYLFINIVRYYSMRMQ